MSARVTAHTHKTKTTNETSNSENRISLYRNLILSFFSFSSVLFFLSFAFVLCEWVNESMSEWARVCVCVWAYVNVSLFQPFCDQSNLCEHVHCTTHMHYGWHTCNAVKWIFKKLNQWMFWRLPFLRSAFHQKKKKCVDKFTKLKTDNAFDFGVYFLLSDMKRSTFDLIKAEKKKTDFNKTHTHSRILNIVICQINVAFLFENVWLLMALNE